jgi:peptidoglycan hydrolase CwlO-like protein
MVKLPNLDDLKKWGNDFVDATKAINIKEMVDHFKGFIPQQNEKTKQLFNDIRATLQELNKAQPGQDALVKKLEQQVAELEKLMAAPTPEDKKS